MTRTGAVTPYRRGMVRRPLLVTTWCVATIAAVVIAWLAVSSAVADVSDPTPAIATVQRADAASTISSALDGAASSSPDGAPTSSDGSSPSPAAGSVPSTVASTPGVGSASSFDNADSRTTPSPPPPATTNGTATTSSFNTSGGVVTMSCNGSSASLVSATPQQGYTTHVDNPGPEEIEVSFTSPSRDATFHGRCVGGTPTQIVDD